MLDKHNNGGDKKMEICSFCDKPSDEVQHLITSKKGNICNECVDICNDSINEKVKERQYKYIYQLLNKHFGNIPPDEITTASRSFPARMRADIQIVLDKEYIKSALKTVGINIQHAHEEISFSGLLLKDRNSKTIAPLQYEDLDIGEDEPIKCLLNGILLHKKQGIPFAILVVIRQDYYGRNTCRVEIAVPAGEKSIKLVDRIFRNFEQAVETAHSYRGKVLSLEVRDRYSGTSSGITVHKLVPISRKDIVLPESTLRLLERNVIDFVKRRHELKRLKMSTKKGLLFFGPPGTGKTHTVNYLASCLQNHTTLLITAEQVGLLAEYFTLARLLQPSILVIEDVDLIARDRSSMDGICEEVLLNQLLNEMDGLREEADIICILTTNRPDMLEAALASRPGRIDQAIEFPLPDDKGREQLIKLYAHGLKLSKDLVQTIVSKTEGVSASFIKELMRRSAQYHLDKADSGKILALDSLESALDEMLFSAGKLNVKLLGGMRE